MSVEQPQLATPICQQCSRYPGKHKTTNLKGNGFRWKCEQCFARARPSGFYQRTPK